MKKTIILFSLMILSLSWAHAQLTPGEQTYWNKNDCTNYLNLRKNDTALKHLNVDKEKACNYLKAKLPPPPVIKKEPTKLFTSVDVKNKCRELVNDDTIFMNSSCEDNAIPGGLDNTVLDKMAQDFIKENEPAAILEKTLDTLNKQAVQAKYYLKGSLEGSLTPKRKMEEPCKLQDGDDEDSKNICWAFNDRFGQSKSAEVEKVANDALVEGKKNPIDLNQEMNEINGVTSKISQLCGIIAQEKINHCINRPDFEENYYSHLCFSNSNKDDTFFSQVIPDAESSDGKEMTRKDVYDHTFKTLYNKLYSLKSSQLLATNHIRNKKYGGSSRGLIEEKDYNVYQCALVSPDIYDKKEKKLLVEPANHLKFYPLTVEDIKEAHNDQIRQIEALQNELMTDITLTRTGRLLQEADYKGLATYPTERKLKKYMRLFPGHIKDALTQFHNGKEENIYAYMCELARDMEFEKKILDVTETTLAVGAGIAGGVLLFTGVGSGPGAMLLGASATLMSVAEIPFAIKGISDANKRELVANSKIQLASRDTSNAEEIMANLDIIEQASKDRTMHGFGIALAFLGELGALKTFKGLSKVDDIIPPKVKVDIDIPRPKAPFKESSLNKHDYFYKKDFDKSKVKKLFDNCQHPECEKAIKEALDYANTQMDNNINPGPIELILQKKIGKLYGLTDEQMKALGYYKFDGFEEFNDYLRKSVSSDKVKVKTPEEYEKMAKQLDEIFVKAQETPDVSLVRGDNLNPGREAEIIESFKSGKPIVLDKSFTSTSTEFGVLRNDFLSDTKMASKVKEGKKPTAFIMQSDETIAVDVLTGQGTEGEYLVKRANQWKIQNIKTKHELCAFHGIPDLNKKLDFNVVVATDADKILNMPKFIEALIKICASP